MEQQQQQQRIILQRVLTGIARLSDPNRRTRGTNHQLRIYGHREAAFDRYSLQHLVHFLLHKNGDDDAHEVVITELELNNVRLSDPSDGGVNVLSAFFSRSDTTLTKVKLDDCNFGTTEDAAQLLAAFQTNGTVTDLTFHTIRNLEGAALGACLANLMQNIPQLQRLDCSLCALRVEGVRAMQPGLRNNQTLKELNLSCCRLGDEGIPLVADALVGNTAIDVVNIGFNGITSRGLDDITRMLESTQLKTITLWGNEGVFGNNDSTRRFARVLSRHEFLKELDLSHCHLDDGGFHLIVDGLVGNTIMEVLNISWTQITSLGLADITRLIESTQLKKIDVRINSLNNRVFTNANANQQFAATLLHKNATVQELLGIPSTAGDFCDTMKMILARNKNLNQVNLLLAPPLPLPRQQSYGTTAMILKTCHKVIAKFAMDGPPGSNSGASAIFTLFRARPALLEKRLKRPPAATGSQQQHDSSSHDAGNDNSNRDGTATKSSGGVAIGGPKRRRL